MMSSKGKVIPVTVIRRASPLHGGKEVLTVTVNAPKVFDSDKPVGQMAIRVGLAGGCTGSARMIKGETDRKPAMRGSQGFFSR